MGSQCYVVEDPLYIEVPSSVILKRHSEHHLSMEPREVWNQSPDNSLRNSKRHKFNVYLYHSGNGAHTSLPYAAQTAVEDSHRNKISYPRIEKGRHILMPEYSSFNDPHLQAYYKRKFVTNKPCPNRSITSRPTSKAGSRPGSRSGSVRSIASTGGQEYHVTVKTGNVKGAGTNARAYITMYGAKGKMTKRRLQNDNMNVFSRGSECVFTVYGPDVGDLIKADVEHDGIGEQQSWYLEEVSVECNGKNWVFPCNQWLSLQRGDGKTDRQLVPQGSRQVNKVPTKKMYEITTHTGDKRGSGTDANVFITVFGKKGRTPKIQLTNGHDTFERGQTDLFKIKTNNLDPVQKIRIEHDNSGFGPGWFLEKVVIISSDTKYYFHCNNWLSDDMGDKQTVRDIAASSDPTGASICVKYIVTVVTGDKAGAGTDADVYIQMFGELGETVEKRLDNARNNFEKGKTDTFPLETPSLGELKRIVLRHDNSGPSPAWYCQNITVCDGLNTYEFPCSRWLAEDEDDGKIQVELWAGKGLDEPAGKGVTYIVRTYTADKRGAGTDANVYVIMFGADDTSSGKMVLKRDTLNAFKRGREDVFEIKAVSLAPLDRITVGHDDSGAGPGWFLDKVTIECQSAGVCQTFLCKKWLSRDEGDGLIERELSELRSARREQAKQTTYEVWIWTTDLRAAGSDSNVFLQLYGEAGQTDIISLDNKSNNFERGSLDKFTVSAPVVGSLFKLRIWHDDSNPAAGWHLDKVQIYEPESGRKALFRCGRWLDRGEDDNETVRELSAVSGGLYPTPLPVIHYKVAVTTGKRLGSGTDADVYLCIGGEKGDTGDRWLRKATNGINKFEKGDTNEFSIEAVVLGELHKIRVGHNNEGASPGWFCESVTVTGPEVQGGGAVTFLVNRWLADDEDDGAIIREVFADSEAALLRTTLYTIKIQTGDVLSAGTDSDVYICVYGDKGNTGKIKLREAIHTSNKFERARVDTFDLEREDLGTLERLTVGHNGRGVNSGWYLDCIEVEVKSAGKNIIFPCERWLSKHEDDGLIERDLFPVEDSTKYVTKIPYQIEIYTSDISNSGTNAAVFVQLYGANGKSEVVNLDNKSDNFEKGQEDTFKIQCRDVGEVHKLRIGHDGKGLQSGWHLEKIILYQATEKRTPRQARWNKDSLRKYYFTCNRWLARSEDDGEVIRELIATDEDGNPISDIDMVTYSVSVHTSDKAGAGSDADIFITLFGENGDSGERALRKSDNINKFEKNQVDTFTISVADLGVLTKAKIRHDDSGGNSAWHCSHVDVTVEGGVTRTFPCKRWLATDEDDGAISRELAVLPEGMSISDADSAVLHLAKQRTTYHVIVYTGDLFGAGTDSDVHIQLFGEKEDSGPIQLKSCKSNSVNKFERDAKDVFFVECIDVGHIVRLKVWTDGSGAGAEWYLEKIKIDVPTLGIKRIYPCEEWFGKDKGDGLLEKELYPALEADESYKQSTRWELTVHTSDVRHAGTDAEVYVILFGDKGASGKVVLGDGQKQGDVFFERGSVDVFVPEIPDIGTELIKLQLGHDGKGRGDGWHCAKVVAKCLNDDGSSLTYTFTCGRWMDKGEADGQLQVDLVPSNVSKKTLEGEETEVENTKLKNETYTLKVHTGNKFGAGTDANCYCTLHGTLGDSGERQLGKSEHMNKFQRDQIDTFTIDCVELGDLYKLFLREDDTSVGADWYVASVTVTDTSSKETVFLCEQWFSKSRGDEQIKRTLYPRGMTMEEIEAAEKATKKGVILKDVDGTTINERTSEEVPESSSEIKYLVTIETGPEKDMGTDADAYIILKSDGDQTEELSLYNMEEEYIPGLKQDFEVEAKDVGEITSIVVGHNGVLSAEAWYISTISVTVPTTGARYLFSCERWLAKDRGDRKLVVEFITSSVHNFGALIPHLLTVTTADQDKAGTEHDVVVKIFGDKGSSEDMKLSNKGSRFNRGMSVEIHIEIPDVGEISRIRASLEKGRNNWLFDKMVLKNLDTEIEHVFVNTEWVEKGQTVDVPVLKEGVISNKLLYTITVITSDMFASGTNANVFIIMYGENGDSGELALEKSTESMNKFERNNFDKFEFNLLSLGVIRRVRIWHDDTGAMSSWHLAKVTVTDTSTEQEFIFYCDKWLSSKKEDKQLSRDLFCDNLPKADADTPAEDKEGYEVIVVVSNKKESGTNHDLWISLEGTIKSSEKWELVNKTGRFFDKGTSDLFFFSSSDLGDITHLRAGLSPRDGVDVDKDAIRQCHLNQVVINKLNSDTEHIFVCNHWLSLPGTAGRKSYRKLAVSSTQPLNTDRPARIRSAAPKLKNVLTKYQCDVKTADKFSAGTDANIFLTIYGKSGDSGKQALVKSGENLFERNKLSSFELELADLGPISKIRIEHDNAGIGSSWYLEFVSITNLTTSDKYMFVCNEWIDKKKGSKQLFRVLWPEGQKVEDMVLDEGNED